MSFAQFTLFGLSGGSSRIPCFLFNQLELLAPIGSGYSYKGVNNFPAGGGLPSKSEFARRVLELPVLVRDLRNGWRDIDGGEETRVRDGEAAGEGGEELELFKLENRRLGWEAERDRGRFRDDEFLRVEPDVLVDRVR